MCTATVTSFRTTTVAVAASLLGTALIFATPQAAYAAPAKDFVRTVETQLQKDAFTRSDAAGVATVAVRIAADGKVLSADLAGSTGRKELDREAVLTAKSISYPKGDRPRTVAVVLRYGNAVQPSESQSAALVNRYVNAKGEALASQNPATPVG